MDDAEKKIRITDEELVLAIIRAITESFKKPELHQLYNALTIADCPLEYDPTYVSYHVNVSDKRDNRFENPCFITVYYKGAAMYTVYWGYVNERCRRIMISIYGIGFDDNKETVLQEEITASKFVIFEYRSTTLYDRIAIKPIVNLIRNATLAVLALNNNQELVDSAQKTVNEFSTPVETSAKAIEPSPVIINKVASPDKPKRELTAAAMYERLSRGLSRYCERTNSSASITGNFVAMELGVRQECYDGKLGLSTYYSSNEFGLTIVDGGDTPGQFNGTKVCTVLVYSINKDTDIDHADVVEMVLRTYTQGNTPIKAQHHICRIFKNGTVKWIGDKDCRGNANIFLYYFAIGLYNLLMGYDTEYTSPDPKNMIVPTGITTCPVFDSKLMPPGSVVLMHVLKIHPNWPKTLWLPDHNYNCYVRKYSDCDRTMTVNCVDHRYGDIISRDMTVSEIIDGYIELKIVRPENTVDSDISESYTDL